MNRTVLSTSSASRVALALLATSSIVAAAGFARAGETVVPEEDLVRAAGKLEAATVRLRITVRGDSRYADWLRTLRAFEDATQRASWQGPSVRAAERNAERAAAQAAAAEKTLAAERAAAEARAAEDAKARPGAPGGAGGGGAPVAGPDRTPATPPSLRAASAGAEAKAVLFYDGISATREVRGVFVGDGHVILTAASAVEGAARIEVVTPGGAVDGIVSAVDRDFGLALVRSSASGEAIEVDGGSELEPGRILLVAGAAQGGGMDVRAVSTRETTPGHRGLGRLAAPLATEAVGAPALGPVGSSRVDLQACKLEYSIVSPK